MSSLAFFFIVINKRHRNC